MDGAPNASYGGIEAYPLRAEFLSRFIGNTIVLQDDMLVIYMYSKFNSISNS